MIPTALAVGLAIAAFDPPGRDVVRKPLVGTVAPELVAADRDWLSGPPAKLAGMKGKVVWLQFNF
jgi:hypothetical protein